MAHLSAAGTHAELGLLTSCKKGNKHFFPPQDSDPHSFVEGQEDGMQRGGSEAVTAPAPPTNPGAFLIQTLTA